VFPVHVNKKVYAHYQYVRNIGKGAFGTVDVVVNRRTGKQWACKSIKAPTKQHLDLVETEIRLMQGLNHPNVLRLNEVYRDGSNFYIISELCEGGSLAEKLNTTAGGIGTRVAEQDASRWIFQILSCLHYLHGKGIAHRDLKPDNILFLSDENNSPVKLIDFGLSSHLDSFRKQNVAGQSRPSLLSRFRARITKKDEPTDNAPMQRAGTLHYMAPEMIRGDYGVKCDIFSLGCILHQMLSGFHPFYTAGIDTEESVRYKILSQEIKMNGYPWDTLSSEFKDLLRKLTSKKEKGRLEAAQAMEHTWLKARSIAPDRVNHSCLTMSVLDILREWATTSEVKQSVIKLLVSRTGDLDLQTQRYHFEKLDREGRGMVSLEQMKKVLLEAGLITESETGELEVLFGQLAGGPENKIGYNQFLASFMLRRGVFGPDDYRELYKQFDTKQAGFLTLSEFHELFDNAANLSKEELRHTIKAPTGEQIITEEGFVQLMLLT